jgi:hypothetical protein
LQSFTASAALRPQKDFYFNPGYRCRGLSFVLTRGEAELSEAKQKIKACALAENPSKKVFP